MSTQTILPTKAERSCEMETTGPCVGVENEANKRQSDMRIKKEKGNTHGTRVSGGAGIPPELQLTQTWEKEHGNMANKQSGDSALAQLHWFPVRAFF